MYCPEDAYAAGPTMLKISLCLPNRCTDDDITKLLGPSEIEISCKAIVGVYLQDFSDRKAIV